MSLSHVDDGNPGMVDVGGKAVTQRSAHARSVVILPNEVAQLFNGDDFDTPKGPVFHTAIIAGTMAAKRTHELIPFCHPLGLEHCRISCALEEGNRIVIDCRVSIHHKTGVEMEALTGASIAALTIYDMLKAASYHMVISETRLVEKTGGKRDVDAQET